MPYIVVSLAGDHLATLFTDTNNVVSVAVAGDVVGPNAATINATAGLYGEAEGDRHLVYLDQYTLPSGDELVVAFASRAERQSVGRTIEELYPNPEPMKGNWTTEEELFEDFRSRSKMRCGYKFRLLNPLGEALETQTEPCVFSFSFYALWDWKHPEFLRLSLSSVTLDEIQQRKDGNTHAKLRLRIGESASFSFQEVSALNETRT
ncbi:MAG: hypothetical protein H6977_00680 [Gammaproteobacteria bacterium]|nr:hypothetical protein [Gammaproteobacteria bacterium]